VGNLYVADTDNHRIRKITPAGEVSTLAGGGIGFSDGIGSTAKFNHPVDIASDAAGNLYVADTFNDRIRKVTPAGEVSTLAGGGIGFADGVGSDARFYLPHGIASDAAGYLYVADSGNNRIRKITPAGEVSTLAGGKEESANGIENDARFNDPSGIAIDAAGNLYVADTENHRIRKITPAGEVSTLAGSEEDFADGIVGDTRFYYPNGVAIDAVGNLYVADTANDRIRKITPAGEVSTLAGGERGFVDGIGSIAKFNVPYGVASDAAGNLYVADARNHRIRKITPAGEVSTLAGSEEGFSDGVGSDAKFYGPEGITIDAAGNLYVVDTRNNSIRKITPAGEVSTLTDGVGSDAEFFWPSGIAIDAAGHLYVADRYNHRIRKITPAGEVSTFAGGELGFADGVGSDAEFFAPSGIASDAAGNLYVADRGNHCIRKITPAGEVCTLAGGEKGFADGVGSDAKFRDPSGIAIDAVGHLYVADSGNRRIRKIEAFLTGCEKTTGVATQDSGERAKVAKVSTLAGGEEGFADGVGGDAMFFDPFGIASDVAGNLYVADFGNHRIRKITPAGEVRTFAGGEEGFADGIGSDAMFSGPFGIASDAAGNLYVADGGNHRIRKVTPTGEVSTFAGGEAGFADGIGSDAKFFGPAGIASDAAGNLYVAEMGNNRIRKITPAGEVSTLAGGERGFADGVGSDAMFRGPVGIAIDAAGNLYVADMDNNRIRKITPAGKVSTLAGGEAGFAKGIGSIAKFNCPSSIAIDAAGNLYVADGGNHRIRKITPAGEVSMLAGGEKGFADGFGSGARFNNPAGIAIDAAGNLYVADFGNGLIRKIEIRRP
jgi:sugar lactone lactonase YvrE